MRHSVSMFVDLSWSHILLLMVVALVVVGPRDLPRLMREMGRWAGKARAMADQFRKSFDEMARQTELDELRREIDELRAMRPLSETERQLNAALAVPEFDPAESPVPTIMRNPAPASMDEPAPIDEPAPASEAPESAPAAAPEPHKP